MGKTAKAHPVYMMTEVLEKCEESGNMFERIIYRIRFYSDVGSREHCIGEN